MVLILCVYPAFFRRVTTASPGPPSSSIQGTASTKKVSPKSARWYERLPEPRLALSGCWDCRPSTSCAGAGTRGPPPNCCPPSNKLGRRAMRASVPAGLYGTLTGGARPQMRRSMNIVWDKSSQHNATRPYQNRALTVGVGLPQPQWEIPPLMYRGRRPHQQLVAPVERAHVVRRQEAEAADVVLEEGLNVCKRVSTVV